MMEVRRDRKGKGQIMILNRVVREDSKKFCTKRETPLMFEKHKRSLVLEKLKINKVQLLMILNS